MVFVASSAFLLKSISSEESPRKSKLITSWFTSDFLFTFSGLLIFMNLSFLQQYIFAWQMTGVDLWRRLLTILWYPFSKRKNDPQQRGSPWVSNLSDRRSSLVQGLASDYNGPFWSAIHNIVKYLLLCLFVESQRSKIVVLQMNILSIESCYRLFEQHIYKWTCVSTCLMWMSYVNMSPFEAFDEYFRLTLCMFRVNLFRSGDVSHTHS